jgi:hypothetical protein
LVRRNTPKNIDELKDVLSAAWGYISADRDTFIQPYLWSNSNSARARSREVKNKRTKKTDQAAIEPQTSSLPNMILRQFSHGDGYLTVTRPL